VTLPLPAEASPRSQIEMPAERPTKRRRRTFEIDLSFFDFPPKPHNQIKPLSYAGILRCRSGRDENNQLTPQSDKLTDRTEKFRQLPANIHRCINAPEIILSRN
jgi:hypothetical protein